MSRAGGRWQGSVQADSPPLADGTIFTGIAYLGVIAGQLGFGCIVDRFGRKSSMLAASCIMIIGSALCAGAYGAHGSIDGMLAALIVYRFITGVGSTYHRNFLPVRSSAPS